MSQEIEPPSYRLLAQFAILHMWFLEELILMMSLEFVMIYVNGLPDVI